MCIKNASSIIRTRSMVKNNKKTTSVSVNDSARKTRTKTRKPKFLSLRLDISPENSSHQSDKMTHQPPQLNLFPLHPENLTEDKDDMQEYHENMSYFLNPPDGDDPTTSLTAILDTKTESTAACGGISSEEGSLTYAYRGQDREEGGFSPLLVKSALRNREREGTREEKWVCYSEVIVEEKKEEEVTSCAADVQYKSEMRQHQRLSLKLDYQEIMNAWSDKGPLYIEGGECPQTVPDLDGGLFGHHDGSNGFWTVPDNTMSKGRKEEVVNNGGEEGYKMGRQREASVLRYKEKRQNRLFSKRIRYEVRKLNAEKRPRMKGRFVKRN